MLTRLGSAVDRWLDQGSPWSNVYGLARTLLALGTIITFTATPANALFRPGTGVHQVPMCAGPRSYGVFCAFAHYGVTSDVVVRWLVITIMAVVASGWRPRVTGLIHAWIAWSFTANAILLDGGDQVAADLAWLLVPVTLTDARRWHWMPAPQRTHKRADDFSRIVANSFLFVVKLQVATIYFQAFVGKLAVPEWVDGTALWYWILHPDLGAPGWLARIFRPILATRCVAVLTWGVLATEGALALGLFVQRSRRALLLCVGIALHAGILVVHGLVSFGLCMFGALILYLRPPSEPFKLLRVPSRPRAFAAAAVDFTETATHCARR